MNKQSQKADPQETHAAKHNSGIGAVPTRKKPRSSLFTFLLVMVVLGGTGAFYLYSEIRQIKNNAAKELASVADMKVNQISNWVYERDEDAKQLMNAPSMNELAISYLHNPLDLRDKSILLQWIQMYQGQEDYKKVSLLNTEGEIVLSVPASISHYSAMHQKFFTEAKDSGKIVVADLHRNADKDGVDSGIISYSYWIPVLGTGADSKAVKGVWVLQIDPSKFLYPLVQSWPVPSKTAETLLVRKEGDQVVFLNELRHRKNSALKLKFKISDNPRLPASLAVLGKEAIIAGNDYRDIPVFSATRKVMGTSWYMVAKVDKKELYDSLLPRIWVSVFLILALMLTVTAFVGYLERKRDADWLKQQLILEQENIEANMAVIDSEARFKAIFDYSSAGKSITFQDGSILPNTALCNMLGYTPKKMKHRWIELTYPDDIPLTQNVVDAIMVGEQDSARFTKRYLHKDGSIVWADVSTILKRDADRKPQYFINTILDITQQKQDEQIHKEAQEALKKSEFRFRELFEHMSNGVSVYQPTEDGQDFIIMDINPEGQRITKSKRADILGKRVGEVFPEIKRKGLLDVFLEVSHTGIAKRCDTYNYIDNQLEYWLDNYVLKLESGEVVALYNDITREVIAKNELHESNEYLQSLFDYANAPIIVWDSHFKIERFNHAFERLTQHQAKEVLGEHLELLFAPENRMDFMAKIRAASQGNNWVSVELPILRKDGQIRIVLCNSANIYDHDGETVLSTFAQGQDITDRIKADDALKKLNEQLENRVIERTALLEMANKELESFSYSVSHDLRSPLRGIEGWSQALAEDYAGRLDEQADDYLRRIRSETMRMNQLIEGLLKLSRVGKAAIILETLNLSKIAQELVDRMREEEPLRQVEISIAPDLMARGDANLMLIVLMNLLSNAWKFTQRTKHARIEFGCEGKDLAGEKPGHTHIVFYIRDNGAGFDMAYATKLFNPFQRLHKATDFPGTGVGLATVQRIIHRHDGDIWVEAEPEKGATFFFYLED